MSSHDRSPAQNEAIAEFSQIMQCDSLTAEEYLTQNDWNLQAAVQSFAEEMMEDLESRGSVNEPTTDTHIESTSESGGIRGGPTAEVLPSSSHTRQPKKKFASLRDLENENDSHGPGGDEDSDKEQEYFTGGDKSGLAVRDPGTGARNDPVQRLIDTARRRGPPPPVEETRQRSFFTGAAQTLGGDDTPSQAIADPNASATQQPEMVQRTLHLWDDGFSVDDGPLYRYNDPANAQLLKMINEGSAPTQVMNVQRGQAVDVNLEQHRGENYQPPKEKYVPFSGSGQRLGSPGAGVSASQTESTPTSTLSAPIGVVNTTTTPSSTDVSINEGEPVVTLQIRLANGTRLRSRFNASHTVADIYAFVDRAQPSGASYTLATTFPTKELQDKSKAIGDLDELKRGGSVVQKWN